LDLAAFSPCCTAAHRVAPAEIMLRLSLEILVLSRTRRPWFIKQSPKGRSHSSEAQRRKGTSELRWSSA